MSPLTELVFAPDLLTVEGAQVCSEVPEQKSLQHAQPEFGEAVTPLSFVAACTKAAQGGQQ